VAPITLEQFEQHALATLEEFGTIASLSPTFDQQWAEHGDIDRAAELLAEWARSRPLASHTVSLHRLEGRTRSAG
jgi:enterochelin esterase-like enzyme